MLRFALALLASLLPVHVIGADDLVLKALRLRVDQMSGGREVRVQGERIAARKLLPALYLRRELRPAWLDPERREQLLALVEGSRTHGLDPSDYHADALRKVQVEGLSDPESVADQELLYSDALVRLVYHLHFGKANPRELYPAWSFSRTLGLTDPVDAVETLLGTEHLAPSVDGYAPQLALYDQLRKALAQLRGIEAAGGWGRVPPDGTLKLGVRDARVTALRARLAAGGDLRFQAGLEPDLFDPPLETAVRGFQTRHGLEPDGAVGRRTLQALDIGVAQRIDQVRVNLERLRWVAQALTEDYLLVDVAGFSARLYLDGRVAWSSRVVVGRLYHETPAFRTELRSIVLNPAWIVPPTILREDVLPRIVDDQRYLKDNDMHVVDGAGREIDPSTIAWAHFPSRVFPYRIVQDPGPANPLGTLKFDMPNRYRVYLHDTPAKQLFERTQRAFSSGCIRLENPRELAVMLLDDELQWSAEALDAAIATGKTRVLALERRVSVLALYLTAEVDEAGAVQFRPDLYGQDAKVLAALAAPFRFAPVDRARQNGSDNRRSSVLRPERSGAAHRPSR